MTIQLYQSLTSMYCEKIRIVLGIKNIQFGVVDVKKDDRKSLITFSGQRKVPVMDFDGQCVIDSTVIAKLLEEKFPKPSIYPDAKQDKALCLMLEDWADEVLNTAVIGLRRAENPDAHKNAEQKLRVHLDSLEQFFTNREFAFDRMTLADLSIFTQLHYLYTSVKYDVPAGYSNLHGWMDRMCRSLKLSSLQDVAA